MRKKRFARKRTRVAWDGVSIAGLLNTCAVNSYAISQKYTIRDTEKINLANHASTEIKAVGTVSITADVDEDKKNVNLSDVFYVPDVHENLMSVAKITHKNLEVIFKKDRAVVVDHSGNVKLRANRIDNLYYLSERERVECYKVSDDVLMHRRIWRCGIDLDT